MNYLGGSKKDLGQWTPRRKDQHELDFCAEEIDKEKADKIRSKAYKRRGRLFECLKESIRMREWNKDSNKRARLRAENEEKEEERIKWNENQQRKLISKRGWNNILDDKQGKRKLTTMQKQNQVKIAKQKMEKKKRNEQIEASNKRAKRKRLNGMERWERDPTQTPIVPMTKMKANHKDRRDKNKQPKITERHEKEEKGE